MAGTSRDVTAYVTLGGSQVACLSVSVSQTKTASKGSVLKAKTTLQTMENAGLGLDWLASTGSVDMTAIFSIDGLNTTMFTGTLDVGSIKMSSGGELVDLTGRDKSSSMTDTKTNEKFINQKSEAIAAQIAARHGLTLDTDGSTKVAGKIYTAEQAKVTGNQSEWTLLRQLAEAEGKVVCVGPNNTLYFRTADDTSLAVYPVFYQRGASGPQSNLVTLSLDRNFQAAQPVTVNVNSWDHKKQQLVTATATSSPSGGIGSDAAASRAAAAAGKAASSSPSAASTPSPQVYTYNHHHLTQDQVTARAKSKLREHTRHEFDVVITMPGDVTLTPFFQIGLTGTQSQFDQNYAIDTLDHNVSSAGYVMSASTKTAAKGRSQS